MGCYMGCYSSSVSFEGATLKYFLLFTRSRCIPEAFVEHLQHFNISKLTEAIE